jgi:hypothetical protein
MKNIFLPLPLFLLLAAPLAQAQQADIFERLGSAGEYPTAYKADRAVTLKVRKAPTTQMIANQECRLRAGDKIGYAEMQKTTQPGVYLAKQDLSFEREGGPAISVQRGERVEELSYLAEGFCQIRVQGYILEDDCPGNGGGSSEQRYEMIKNLEQQSWYYVSCRNTNGWVLSSELEQTSGLSTYSNLR